MNPRPEMTQVGGKDLPKKASDNMLEQPHSLLLNQLCDHIAQDRTYSVKPLICMTNVCKPYIIQQYLLHNEDRNGLAELRARLHDAKAKRDDLSS